MDRCLICCAILRPELEHLFAELAADSGEDDLPRFYLEPALHVDLDKLKQALASALSATAGEGKRPLIVYGRLCHPEIESLVGEYGAKISPAVNCIELLLGEDMAAIEKEAKTFYLTPGWLENWKQIFVEGLGWDSIDARQNFGMYDRILLLDTGVTPLDEEKILEFFDYTQVPVEIRQVDLENLRCNIRLLLEEVDKPC
ncbi:MAG TPA: DUF1638 domain-containing protein [Desulfotomaculum sp.]|nr:DUF1638 domain-containing protein [Desulfotomaculum sp.]